MLRVSYAEISAVPDQPEGLPLSAYRLERLASLRSSLRRQQGIAAELLLIRSLQQVRNVLPLPLVLSVSSGGKPCLADPDLYFSLSHSGAYAACALSDHPLGLDLELEAPPREPLLRRCFSAAEREYIRSSPEPAAAFTELWTRKESFVKATGEGIRAIRREQELLTPSPGLSIWHTRLGRLHLSVCVLDGPAEPDLLEQIHLP